MIVREGKCQYCGVKIAVMTTTTGSLLPVEYQEGVITPPHIFDHRIHKSHLLNCERTRMNWEKKKEKIWKGYRTEISELLAEPECKPEF